MTKAHSNAGQDPDDELLGQLVLGTFSLVRDLVGVVDGLVREVRELRGLPCDEDEAENDGPDEEDEEDAEDVGPSAAWMAFVIGHEMFAETDAAMVDPEVVLDVAFRRMHEWAAWTRDYSERGESYATSTSDVASCLFGPGDPPRGLVNRVGAVLRRHAGPDGPILRLKPRRPGWCIGWWPSDVAVPDYILADYVVADG